jgi:hypothetical protein
MKNLNSFSRIYPGQTFMQPLIYLLDRHSSRRVINSYDSRQQHGSEILPINKSLQRIDIKTL